MKWHGSKLVEDLSGNGHQFIAFEVVNAAPVWCSLYVCNLVKVNIGRFGVFGTDKVALENTLAEVTLQLPQS